MSLRTERAESQISKKLSEIIMQMKDPRISSKTITISNVEIAPDFTFCKVLLSVLSNSQNEKEMILSLLNKSRGFIKKQLASELNMPNVPDLKLILDKGYENEKRIQDILNSLDIPKETE